MAYEYAVLPVLANFEPCIINLYLTKVGKHDFDALWLI